jgi:hypothetical protein
MPTTAEPREFNSLTEIARSFRTTLQSKEALLLFAHNGTGKTRLSTEFKNLGKQGEHRDTLYFNAFTEDLFTWDNDLEGDSKRVLKLNTASRFFGALASLEMDTRIKRFLNPYCDFDFRITDDTVSFSRTRQRNNDDEPAEDLLVQDIKVSRSEEQLFKWCFFLAILEAALDGVETYNWVRYVYVDDPVSSLDEENAIALAHRLAGLVQREDAVMKVIISTHHTLFFNVLKKKQKYILSRRQGSPAYKLTSEDGDTPSFHHISLLQDMQKAMESDSLYAFHFNQLRSVFESTASFHGYKSFRVCLKHDENDPDAALYARVIDIMSHGNYSLYAPKIMTEDNKRLFRLAFEYFRTRYRFNPWLFGATEENVV